MKLTTSCCSPKLLTWGPAKRGARQRVTSVFRRKTLGRDGFIPFRPFLIGRAPGRGEAPAGTSGSDEADDKLLLS